MAYLSGKLSKTLYNSSTGGKKEKNNVDKLCKDDERTAKEGTNTNHHLTQPCCCGEAARTAHVQAEYGEHRSTAPR